MLNLLLLNLHFTSDFFEVEYSGEPIAFDKESDMLLVEVISKCDKYFDEDSLQYLLWE